MKRTKFDVSLVFNGLRISEVIIDQHYRIRHPEMSDQIIIHLLLKLNGVSRKPEKQDSQYSYFVEEPIFLDSKPYRLIMVLEKGKHYMGVINAFRVKEKKYGISI